MFEKKRTITRDWYAICFCCVIRTTGELPKFAGCGFQLSVPFRLGFLWTWEFWSNVT